MKILFINPKRALWAKNPKISAMFDRNKSFIKPWYTPPLSILILAACTPPEHEVEFIDHNFEEIDFNKHYDIVAITAMTQQINEAYLIAQTFKARGIPVAIGGIHATVLPDEVLKHADHVFVGECEKVWPEFLIDLQKGMARQKYQHTSGSAYDLSTAPIPRYDLVNENFFVRNVDFYNMIPIQVTRGCPHNCIFCAVSKIYGKLVRKKPIERVVKEVQEIQSRFSNRLIVFVDDNLFIDKSYAKELLWALTPLHIKWFAQTDVSFAQDEELLKLSYNAGCVMVLIGFESLSEDNLSAVNRNQWKKKQRNNYASAVNKIQEQGIIVYAAFIIGLDHDTVATFSQIAHFMNQNKCLGQFTILTPIPGTDLYEHYLKQHRIVYNGFWQQTSFFDIVFKHPFITKEEFEDNFIWLYDQVFNTDAAKIRMKYMKNIYKNLPVRWQV